MQKKYARRSLLEDFNRSRWYYGLIAPTILVLLVVNIYPLLYSVYVSVTNYKLTGVKNLNFVGIKNYIDLLNNADFVNSMKNTLIYVVCAVTSELIVGLALALLLYRLGSAGNALLSFFLLPMMLTPVIVGIMWRFMYNYDFGMINRALSAIGLDRVAFLSDSSRAIFYLCIVDLWQWSPYVTLLTYGALQSLPRDQIESASIDGAGVFRTFRHITLPFLSSTLWVCTLIRIMDAIREYDKVYTMTMGGPGNATETASFYIYRQAFRFFRTGSAAAASIILLLITIIISNIFVKRMRKNEYKN
ncbi:MAG: sugar ABC transporter permease [Clostridia bacterium]|nr:sugar ABC transporter permease [Clostridia bacterium]